MFINGLFYGLMSLILIGVGFLLGRKRSDEERKELYCRGYDHAGAIMIKDSTVTLEDVNILGCKTDDEEGGAIYIDGGSLTYRGGSISGCESADDGGAI